MSAASTIPFTTPRSASQPWTPTDRDRLIFQWVKFEGHKQSWVADKLGMNQSTVSRTVERYERWIARGGPGMQGSLSHDERLRSQRWLTYERNEWLLASALRLAGEMERAIDSSKSNITRHSSESSRDIEVRTEHKVVDRSGTACRYLRLAYRINMDQLKLVEQDELPPLEPLSVEESDDHDHRPTLADSPADDPCSPHAPSEEPHVVAGSPDPATWGCQGHSARADRENESCPADESSNCRSEPMETPEQTSPFDPLEAPAIPATSDLAVTSIQLSPSASPMHRVHKAPSPNSSITFDAPTDYDENIPGKKALSSAYAVATVPPELVDTSECVFLADTASSANASPS